MKAYQAGISKEEFIAEIVRHQAADNFIKGTYEKGQKGCAVGCSIMSINKLRNREISCYSHAAYEECLGIPEWLARLEDTLFEGVSLERSKQWPLEFSESINEGADLEAVRMPFLVYVLGSNVGTLKKLLGKTAEKGIKELIEDSISTNNRMIAALLAENEEQAMRVADKATREAIWAVEVAARDVTLASRVVGWAAKDAAKEAEREASYVTVWGAEAAARTAKETKVATYEKLADKLLKLLKECR